MKMRELKQLIREMVTKELKEEMGDARTRWAASMGMKHKTGSVAENAKKTVENFVRDLDEEWHEEPGKYKDSKGKTVKGKWVGNRKLNTKGQNVNTVQFRPDSKKKGT